MPTTAVRRIHDLEVRQVHDEMNAGRIALIDVREPAEYAGERISGATLMPLSSFDPAKALSTGNGARLVLHCYSGSRSMRAAQLLLNAGQGEAFCLAGGIEAWKRAGLPIERDAKAPVSVLRQVQITAGSLVLIGSILGFAVSPWWFLLSGFIGAGLVVAGITDTCGMAMILAKMPWNRA